MPYIEKDRRGLAFPESSGELAFELTKIWKDYLETRGGIKFVVLTEIFGATLLALLEFWWRVVRPYEDLKRKENGDVF